MPLLKNEKSKEYNIIIPIPDNEETSWGIKKSKFSGGVITLSESKFITLPVNYNDFSNMKDFVVKCTKKAIVALLINGLKIEGKSIKFGKKTIDDIEKFGCHLALYEPDNYLPGFAYTIGLYKKFKRPEIICFGLHNDVMGAMLNNACELIKRETSLIMLDMQAGFMTTVLIFRYYKLCGRINSINFQWRLAVSHKFFSEIGRCKTCLFGRNHKT